MNEQIKEALEGLNPENPTLWNREGLPKVETIQGITGDTKINREDIEATWPGFTLKAARELKQAREATEEQATKDSLVQASETEKPPEPPSAEAPVTPSTIEIKPPIPVPAYLAVDIEDTEILGMKYQAVIADLAFVKRGIAEFNRQVFQLTKRKEDISKKITELATRAQNLSAVEQRLESREKKDPVSGIKAYINKQNEIRRGKALRAQEFIKAGTTVKDVQAALQHRSKIDIAMGARKTPIGGKRPHYPSAVTGR